MLAFPIRKSLSFPKHNIISRLIIFDNQFEKFSVLIGKLKRALKSARPTRLLNDPAIFYELRRRIWKLFRRLAVVRCYYPFNTTKGTWKRSIVAIIVNRVNGRHEHPTWPIRIINYFVFRRLYWNCTKFLIRELIPGVPASSLAWKIIYCSPLFFRSPSCRQKWGDKTQSSYNKISWSS